MVGWCSMGTFNDPCIWVGVKIQEPGDCRFWCNVSVLAIHFCVPQFWLIPWVEIIYIYHLVIKHSHGRSTCLIGTPSISICAIFHGKLLVITRGCIYIYNPNLPWLLRNYKSWKVCPSHGHLIPISGHTPYVRYDISNMAVGKSPISRWVSKRTKPLGLSLKWWCHVRKLPNSSIENRKTPNFRK